MGTRSHTTATKAALALGIFLTPPANLSFKPPAFRAAPEGATNIGHEYHRGTAAPSAPSI